MSGLLESLLSTVERLADTVRLQQQAIEILAKRVDVLDERRGEYGEADRQRDIDEARAPGALA